MERLEQELEHWLPEQFPGAEVSLELGRPGTKLSGILAWGGFNGLEPIDRQSLLWRALRARFSREDQLRIAILVTLMPAKYSVQREPQLA
jgi:hypothetical protein